MGSQRLKRRLLSLYKQDSRCHWCGVETTYSRTIRQAGQKLPQIEATIDHLVSRNNKQRRIADLPNKPRTVLSCHACNQKRNKIEISLMTQKES